MNDFGALIRDCDALIRVGRPHEVAGRLAHLNPSRVPREWRLPTAKICRRAGLYGLGMKLLASTVRPARARKTNEQATPGELAEYSVLLFRIGAVNEALETLAQVDTTKLPDALLYRAFAHFACWEYETAIPLLEKYIQTPIPAYDQLVGRLNLGFALVEARHYKRALPILETTLELAKQDGHLQILSTCYAFRGQAHLLEGEFSLAQQDLDSAKSLFTLQQNNDHFIVKKWNLILDGLTKKNLAPFAELRELARKRCDWEALRDADFFSLKVEFDLERFLHLYFGSPFPELRERIQKEFGRSTDRTIYILGPKKAPRFEITSGKLDGIATDITGGKSHQLIEALLRDFYRPLQIAGLFSAVYPDEKFNVFSSSGRVHELIRRTREWLANEKIPVIIEEGDGFYSLSMAGNFSFRVPLNRQPVDLASIQLSEMKIHFPSPRTFTTEEARRQLNLSTASVQRLINQAIKNGEIERLGESKRSTSYRICAKLTDSCLRAA